VDYQTITYELSAGIALITLNRADKMNALTTQMRAELAHAVTQGGKEARVVVMTGAGRAFCSGQDLGDRATASNVDLERTLRDEYQPMLHAIVNCPVPTVAAVNGAAAGYVLPRQMGMAKAMGAALFADKISARLADDWGMIWQAVPDAEFDAHWRERAAHLAAGPTAAYAAAKTVIRGSWNNTLEEQLTFEAQEQGKCGKSRDFKEGVLAFTEKRSAQFEGR